MAKDSTKNDGEPSLKKNYATFALLHLAVFILSIGTICTKFASFYNFLSLEFCLLYGGMIVSLGIYAVIWQQILKKISLTAAFVNKSASLIWSVVWGILLFGEQLSWNMCLGILVVFTGVILVITGSKKKIQEVAEGEKHE